MPRKTTVGKKKTRQVKKPKPPEKFKAAPDRLNSKKTSKTPKEKSDERKQKRLNNNLFKACEREDLKKVKEWLEKGAEANAKNKDNLPILTIVVGKGNVGIAELLISKGAKVDATDVGGRTALMAACSWEHLEMAELLIKNKADVDAQDSG